MSQSPSNLPPISDAMQSFINTMMEDILVDDQPFENYATRLKSFCEAEDIDNDNLEYDLRDLIGNFRLSYGSPDGKATAFGMFLVLQDAPACYVSREEIDKICNMKDHKSKRNNEYNEKEL